MTETTDIVATAGTGSVGRSLTFGVTITRPLGAVASNQLSGVVTATLPRGGRGRWQMYAVAGVPVRAVVGATPFYRDLVRGASGADVRQLKDALEVLGYLRPSGGDVFTAAVERAVKSWQTSAKQTATGVVRLGSSSRCLRCRQRFIWATTSPSE
ncbi:peptidoglycan-binding domain-containing protein [Oerskovia sp. M15]